MAVSVELADGGSIIAWSTADGIFFERFSDNFTPLGSPVEVAAGPSAWLSAAPLADGGFSVIWDASAASLSTAKNYDSSGLAAGVEYTVAAPPSAETAFTSLADFQTAGSDGSSAAAAVFPDGGSVTAAYNADTGPFAEQVQRTDAGGNPIGPEFVGPPGFASADDDTMVATTATGGYAVSYLDQSAYSSQLDVESFAANGTHLSSATLAALAFTGNYTFYPEILAQSIAGLPDGGFVVSWTAQDNAAPEVYSEEITAAGASGPVALLGASAYSSNGAYTTPEIDVFPDGHYAVSWNSPTGQEQATFMEESAPLPTGTNDTIDTPSVSYVLPNGPHDVVLVGATAQTVVGNSLGDTITSNDYGSTITGGTGNDTLIAGHGADILTGGGGSDTFVFNYLPWNAGQITDFNTATDTLDLSGIFASIGYTGSNPVADGYLTFTSDGKGDTLVEIMSHQASDPWPTLVTTLDHVSPSSITAQDWTFQSPAPAATVNATPIDTAAAEFTVPNGFDNVVLTGSSAQTVIGNSLGDTIASNDFGSTITGGTGNDTLIAGHGADILTGGGGTDNFVFNYLPWNAGQITDFNTATDTLDLSGIFGAIGYTGNDPIADGYLTFTSDGKGDTLVEIISHQESDPWPTLITTLDHVSPSSITAQDWTTDASASSSTGTGSTGGTTVSTTPVDTAAALYTVPSGVENVVLTGTSAQTVIGNSLGDTIASNNFGSTITGGTGNDTLIAGQAADVLTGGGGNDNFVFNNLPWSAGHITDFNTATDTLDVSGIMSSIGYTGSNPVADGYLSFIADNAGDTKVVVNPQGPGTTIPILVTTLDHVAPAAIHAGDWIFA